MKIQRIFVPDPINTPINDLLLPLVTVDRSYELESFISMTR